MTCLVIDFNSIVTRINASYASCCEVPTFAQWTALCIASCKREWLRLNEADRFSYK